MMWAGLFYFLGVVWLLQWCGLLLLILWVVAFCWVCFRGCCGCDCGGFSDYCELAGYVCGCGVASCVLFAVGHSGLYSCDDCGSGVMWVVVGLVFVGCLRWFWFELRRLLTVFVLG